MFRPKLVQKKVFSQQVCLGIFEHTLSSRGEMVLTNLDETGSISVKIDQS